MKKITLLFSLILFTLSSYAQEPTKEDAMDFIAKKFAANIVSPRKFHSYNNGVFKYYTPSGSICTLYLNKLTGWSHEVTYNGNFYYYSLTGKNIQKDGLGEYEDSWYTLFSYSDEYQYIKYEYIINVYQEDNLRGRLEKAFDTLIKFNTIDSGDKF